MAETALRACTSADHPAMLQVINDAAMAYKGRIPDDCWREPYMSSEELAREIASGVVFWGQFEGGRPSGVMGIQYASDVTLIRHAYVLTNRQGEGIGGRLMERLLTLAKTPTVLVGTWAAAGWAVRFYQRRGFRLVPPKEKDRLLGKYWSISERQVETSVVLKLLRRV